MATHVEDSPQDCIAQGHVANVQVEAPSPTVVEDAPTSSQEQMAPRVQSDELDSSVLISESSPTADEEITTSNEARLDAPHVEVPCPPVAEDTHPSSQETAAPDTQARAESSTMEETAEIDQLDSSQDEARSDNLTAEETLGPAQQVNDADQDEVVLESSFIPSSSHPQLHRQAVRESPSIDSHCAREAAMMLRCLPPLEAARLALSMEDEERLAAFSYMNHEERSAVIAGMPFDTAVAAGLMDPSFDAEMEELLLTDDGDDEGGWPTNRSKNWFPPKNSFGSNSRVSNISSKARGAASSAASSVRQGLTQAVERGRTVEMPAKVTEYGGKVSGTASRTAALAREKMLQATEKAKVSAEKSKVAELGGRAVGVAGNVARRAKEATVHYTPSSTGEAKEKAKEKVAVAADTASHAFSSMSKGFANIMKRPSQQKSPP